MWYWDFYSSSAAIEQQDRSVAHAIQFQVGDKCLVPVPGELSCFYNGEVSSPIKPNGCHMVCHMTHDTYFVPYSVCGVHEVLPLLLQVYIFDVGEQ